MYDAQDAYRRKCNDTSPARLDRLVVLYIPALDLRRVDPKICPHLFDLLASYPWVRMLTLPAVDHVPTMLTGTYPDEHGLWGPKLKADHRVRTVAQRLIDCLPDLVTTTVQCALHMVHGPVDLATIAPKRRRRFEIARFKYVKHVETEKVVLPINGKPSIFTALGATHCRYVFQDDHRRLQQFVDEIAEGDQTLEMVEAHSLDRLGHWNLDNEERMAGSYHCMDDFVAAVHAKCRRTGTGLLLLSDHGMEPVIGYVDLYGELGSLDVPSDDYDMFVENTKSTFWFHSDAARSKIMSRLTALEHAALVPREEMKRFGLHFLDNCYGDAYFYTSPGYTFYPNDFHRRLASWTLALMDWQQRPRLRDPRHRGDHGYFPEHPSENGFMLLAEQGFATTSNAASLVDFAPSVLGMLGREVPDCMKGKPIFIDCEGARDTT